MSSVTIITTMYNSFAKMGKYLNSLRCQTNKDFTVIFVDDCSTDDSFNALKAYLAAHDFNQYILLQTPQNSGPGGARNHALDQVQSEYFLFLDSDDYMDDRTIEKIVACTKRKYDCVFFDTIIENANHTRRIAFCNKYGVVDHADAIKSSNTGICSKIYKTDIVKKNKIVFPNSYNGEDMAFNFVYYSFCSSFYHVKDSFYHYVFEASSLSNGDYNRKLAELEKSIAYIKHGAVADTPFLNYVLLREHLYCSLQLMFAKRSSNKEISAFLKNRMRSYSFQKLYEVSTWYQILIFRTARMKTFFLWRFLMGRKTKI